MKHDSEIAEVLRKIDNLPDKHWLLKDCHTDDQRRHWAEVRKIFQYLCELLKSHYYNEPPNLPNLPKKESEFLLVFQDSSIKHYELIKCCWKQIEALLLKKDWSEKAPNTPGQMFCRILEELAGELFYPCLEVASPELGRFSPRAEYESYLKSKSILNLIESAKVKGRVIKTSSLDRKIEITDNCGNLRKLDKQRIERYYKQELKFELLQFRIYHDLCWITFGNLAKRSPIVRSKLEALEGSIAELNKKMYSNIHPSKGVRGWQWVNGFSRPLT